MLLKKYQWNIFKAVLVSATSSVLSGYDQGVIAAAMITMQPDLGLSMTQEEVSIGVLNVAAAFGGLLAGQLADRFGRRLSLALANILFFVGSLMLAACEGFSVLALGRVIMGLGVGVALVVAPMYTAELVPPERRGGLVAMCDVSTNLGILMGYGSGLLFYGLDDGWRYMFLLGAFPAAVLLAALAAIPESPRWLVAQARPDDAKRVLLQLSASPGDAEHALAAIARAQEDDKDCATWADVFFPQDPVTRRMIFCGMGVAFFSQATGTEAAVYYTPTILKSAGFEGNRSILVATMGVGSCKVLALVVATMFFDRVGRKPMLLLSAAGLFVAYCIEGASSILYSSGGNQGLAQVLALVGLCLYMAAFSVGFSPLTYVVCTEVFPSHVRAKALSVALFVTRSLAGAISMSFESLLEAFTPTGVWFGFAAVSVAAFAFVAKFLPETKGLSLEKVRDTFSAYLLASNGGDRVSGSTPPRVTTTTTLVQPNPLVSEASPVSASANAYGRRLPPDEGYQSVEEKCPDPALAHNRALV